MLFSIQCIVHNIFSEALLPVFSEALFCQCLCFLSLIKISPSPPGQLNLLHQSNSEARLNKTYIVRSTVNSTSSCIAASIRYNFIIFKLSICEEVMLALFLFVRFAY